MTDAERASFVATCLVWADQLKLHGYDLAVWHNPRLMVTRLEQMAAALQGGPLPNRNPPPRAGDTRHLELNTWRDVFGRRYIDPAIESAIRICVTFGLEPDVIAPSLIVGLSELREGVSDAFKQHLATCQQPMPAVALPKGIVLTDIGGPTR